MRNKTESGAITIAETLIALAIGLVALTLWAQSSLNQMEIDRAKAAGRAIAAYARAASIWLSENPPATNGNFDIANLQDCDDEDGARFLPCSFNSQSPVPYAYDSEGNPMTLGTLQINTTVSSAGAAGEIDFGVFRSGDDLNDDGLPDSRPDLAAIANATASEQSGAGGLGFYQIRFARSDPEGLVFNPESASFSQVGIDNLSRLIAQVGITAADPPFLRTDGTNEMRGGLTFENGMQVAMDGTGLSIRGAGNVEVETDTGTLVVSNELQTPNLEADNAEFDSLTVEPADGVIGAGFDRFNQAPDVARIDGDIVQLTSRVGANETNIENNTEDIGRLSTEVDNHSTSIENNRTEIAGNSETINDNSIRITTLEDGSGPVVPECTPSMQAKISEFASRGFRYYYDVSTSAKNCNSGVSCSTTDRCGDTVPSRIRFVGPSSANPVQYNGRNSSDLQCVPRQIRFYQRCGCVAPNPPGCR